MGIFLAMMVMGSPCGDAIKSHQFDFWIGTWDVYQGEQKVGVNRIEPILDGCVLQENWDGTGGSKGTSLNFWNATTGKWNQFWVYQNGRPLPLLEGGLEGEAMVLKGVQKTKAGKALHEIRWTPNEDGTVTQHWRTSTDEGKTWKTSFLGEYRKR